MCFLPVYSSNTDCANIASASHNLLVAIGNQPAIDAPCVAKLIAAGAILLGKTDTTEFATANANTSHNPHNPAHTPGEFSTPTLPSTVHALSS